MSRIEKSIASFVKIGRRTLFVRFLNEENLPSGGFHLPCVAYEKGNPEKAIKDSFRVIFGAKVNVRGCLLPMRLGEEEITPYLVEEATPIRFPTRHFEYGYFKQEDLKNRYVNPLHALAAEKAYLYLPLLMGTKREKPLSPSEIDKVNAMFDSFRFFKDAIKKEERKQFARLIDADIDYEGILAAYRFLLREAGVNYYAFADYQAHLKGKKSHL